MPTLMNATKLFSFISALDTNGAIRSFHRGCGPSVGNKCEEEINTVRKNCFTSCKEELCNSGSGYDPNNPTDARDPDVEDAAGNTGDDNDDNENVTGNTVTKGDKVPRYYDPNSAPNNHCKLSIILSVLMILPVIVTQICNFI